MSAGISIERDATASAPASPVRRGAGSRGNASGASEPTPEFALTQDDFTRIAKILQSEAGIVLSPSKSALVYSRLAKRLRLLGIDSFKAYCEFVSGTEGTAERGEMLSALTTNVTHFFREKHHFDHLRASVFPGLVAAARRGGRVRIWSAGCSQGQEPYSIALTLLSMMPDALDHDVRILASDIDPNVVRFGAAGIYSASVLEPVPSDLRRRYFEPVAGQADSFRVTDVVRDLVAFRELNLIGTWPMRGTFQVIMCRNVTIYFDQPTREAIWGRFADYLDPAGWLYIGHSERLSGAPAARLELRRRHHLPAERGRCGMKPVRVVVVDDSATMRALLKRALTVDPGIVVVGEAANPYDARAKIKALDPDVITLDVEMPNMNGLEFLEKLMRLRPMPVLMVSSLTAPGAETALAALSLGAFECIAKPSGADAHTLETLPRLVREAARAKHSVGAMDTRRQRRPAGVEPASAAPSARTGPTTSPSAPPPAASRR